jgi:hypothetical protein
MCPLRYWFSYVEGIKKPAGADQVEGYAHHDSMQFNNNYKIAEKHDRATEDVIEFFEDNYSSRYDEMDAEQRGDTEKDTVLNRGRTFIDVYIDQVSPGIQPLDCERKFSLSLHLDGETVPVIGYIDLEQVGCLSDYKVVGKTKNQAEADSNLQLGVYGAAVNDAPDQKVEFICFVKTKTPKIVRVSSSMYPGRSSWAARVCADVIKAISAGSFPPCDPTSWACSEKWCDYYCECRGSYGNK